MNVSFDAIEGEHVHKITVSDALCPFVSSTVSLPNVIYGLRIVVFLEGAEGVLSPKDKILIGNNLFEMYKTATFSCAISTVPVFYCRYEDINKKINMWHRKYKNSVCIVKEKKKQEFDIFIQDVTLPHPNHIYQGPDGPCWTREISSRFAGKVYDTIWDCYETPFIAKTLKNKEAINVCPFVPISSDIFGTQEEPSCFQLYEKNGYLFSLFNYVKVPEKGLICLNSIGTSCFSTGFCDNYKNKFEQEMFINESEVQRFIRGWANKIFTEE